MGRTRLAPRAALHRRNRRVRARRASTRRRRRVLREPSTSVKSFGDAWTRRDPPPLPLSSRCSRFVCDVERILTSARGSRTSCRGCATSASGSARAVHARVHRPRPSTTASPSSSSPAAGRDFSTRSGARTSPSSRPQGLRQPRDASPRAPRPRLQLRRVGDHGQRLPARPPAHDPQVVRLPRALLALRPLRPPAPGSRPTASPSSSAAPSSSPSPRTATSTTTPSENTTTSTSPPSTTSSSATRPPPATRLTPSLRRRPGPRARQAVLGARRTTRRLSFCQCVGRTSASRPGSHSIAQGTPTAAAARAAREAGRTEATTRSAATAAAAGRGPRPPPARGSRRAAPRGPGDPPPPASRRGRPRRRAPGSSESSIRRRPGRRC